MQFGPISSDDLRAFLGLAAAQFEELDKARTILLAVEDKALAGDCLPTVWCHLYELPAKEHFGRVLVSFGAEGVIRQLAQSPNQIQAIPEACGPFAREIDEWEPTEAERNDLRRSLGIIFGLALSALNSMRCLLTFGHYLNDLVAIVRDAGPTAEKALIRAIKIDPTVLGCPSVSAYVSRAVLMDDQRLLASIRRAMGGKLTKREQKTYQQMRLVLQVLSEVGVQPLGKDDLYNLFRDELNLVRDEAGEGDVKEALRQFAYQFLREKSVSQNA